MGKNPGATLRKFGGQNVDGVLEGTGRWVKYRAGYRCRRSAIPAMPVSSRTSVVGSGTAAPGKTVAV